MGLIHLYCGNGKGKTTASIGLAVRAAGAGMNVVIVQFLKGTPTAETNILDIIDKIAVIRSDFDYGFDYREKAAEITDIHNKMLKQCLEHVSSGECGMLILDEITYPYNMDLIDKTLIDALILNKPEELELVLTGRNPADIMVDNADYISEIKEIKHPFTQNIPARKGIEF